MPSSPAQKRAQADLAAFVKVMGRRPRKGETTKGFRNRKRAGGAKVTTKKARKAAQAAGDAPKKRRKRRLSWDEKAWRWVKKNPVKTGLGLLAAGGTAVAATQSGRQAVSDTYDKTALAVKSWMN